jgi:radical SAM protein with 4Fe4S-binding SPASM domain
MTNTIFDYCCIGYNAFFKPEKPFGYPKQINIEITNACNMRCKMCSRPRYVDNINSITFDQFRYIADIFKPRLLSIAGLGEPLLHSELMRMSDYTYHRYGTLVSITSNGTLLHDNIENIANSSIYLINVSLDAACSATYKQIRGKDFFDQIIRSICDINYFTKDKQKRNPKFGAHFVVQHDNFREINDIIQIAHKNDFINLLFLPLELESLDSELANKLIGDLTKNKLYDAIQSGNILSRKLGVNTNLNIWLRDFDKIWMKYEMNMTKPFSLRPCVRPWVSLYIDHNGDITPCCLMTYGAGKLVIGNIYKEDFRAIWNNGKIRSFRNAIKRGNKYYPICDTCIPLTIVDKFFSFTRRKLL